MTKINDGGPAFPHDGRDNGPGNIKGRAHDGMTLRDWFAGQALAGYASNCDQDGVQSWRMDDMVRKAYRSADAMLAAREAGE